MHIDRNEIDNLDKEKRKNLINSISGIKPANLIGTISDSGITNLAIFKDIVHLGSNPPLIGFILRPWKGYRRDTYNNIRQNGYYTINHVHYSFVKQAHYTSGKFDEDVTEFEQCELTEEYLNGFKAPFVKESLVKTGLKHVQSIPIEINDTTLVIGEIKHIVLPDETLDNAWHIDLEKAGSTGVGGLNSYFELTNLEKYPHIGRENILDFL